MWVWAWVCVGVLNLNLSKSSNTFKSLWLQIFKILDGVTMTERAVIFQDAVVVLSHINISRYRIILFQVQHANFNGTSRI